MKTLIRCVVIACFVMAVVAMVAHDTGRATFWLVLAVFNYITEGRLE